ncbi:hypothetical protein BCON_0207g00230 [Botryotinia convoluta]|uniref:Uncharacterized protein n=1 Tax=Botryotinia convoluta TaxID=54673 RepID=A0A4Z1HKZ8_9HELO|nr:hypothetical protein BCON_0207g00230 [Botryotinia convoluta]
MTDIRVAKLKIAVREENLTPKKSDPDLRAFRIPHLNIDPVTAAFTFLKQAASHEKTARMDHLDENQS